MSPKKKIQRITHSPLPWIWFTKYDQNQFHQDREAESCRHFVAADGQGFALTCGLQAQNDVANADLIVRACNSHYQLLKACKRALRELKPRLDDPPAKKRLCLQLGKAIRQAEKVIK